MHDELIGRLLERTEHLAARDDSLGRALDRLDDTLDSLRDTMTQMKVALEHIGTRMEQLEANPGSLAALEAKLDKRLSVAEAGAKDWLRVKSIAIKYAVWIAGGAIFAGSAGGQLMLKVMGWE